MKTRNLTETLERIVPDEINKNDDFGMQSLQLHVERYEFAKKHLLPGRLLDMACGCGYGSYLLATGGGDKIKEVIGMDIAEDAIVYARQRYPHPLIKFVQADIKNLNDSRGFDTIVSLETIEHLAEPADIIKKYYEKLLPGGKMVVSAPITPSMDANPFHLNDFTKSSFKNLFAPYRMQLVDELEQKQRFYLRQVLGEKRHRRLSSIRSSIAGYYLRNPSKLITRIYSLLVYGFNNNYLTVVFKKPLVDNHPIQE